MLVPARGLRCGAEAAVREARTLVSRRASKLTRSRIHRRKIVGERPSPQLIDLTGESRRMDRRRRVAHALRQLPLLVAILASSPPPVSAQLRLNPAVAANVSPELRER